MLLAIIFILSGILIAVYPELLSIIVATFLIFIGVVLLYFRYGIKKASRRYQNPFIDFFTRY